MNKFMPLAVVVLALLVVVLGYRIISQADKVSTLYTVADARSGVGTPIDLGTAGDSSGDMFVFDEPLLNGSGQKIGANSGFCIRTLPGQFSECQWTLTLPEGSITVAGREADNGTSYIPIIGGTGAYVRASGVLTSIPNGNRTYTQSLALHQSK